MHQQLSSGKPLIPSTFHTSSYHPPHEFNNGRYRYGLRKHKKSHRSKHIQNTIVTYPSPNWAQAHTP